MPKRKPKAHPLAIHCDRHGESRYCLICRHLGEGSGLRFWSIRATAKDPAQAWCEACDAVLEGDRGRTDRACAFADWQLYCTQCYRTALVRHTRLGWVSGGRPADDG